eukprot:1547615-Amphidinium_carterae.1
MASITPHRLQPGVKQHPCVLEQHPRDCSASHHQEQIGLFLPQHLQQVHQILADDTKWRMGGVQRHQHQPSEQWALGQQVCHHPIN